MSAFGGKADTSGLVGLALGSRKHDCLEGHPTLVTAELLI